MNIKPYSYSETDSGVRVHIFKPTMEEFKDFYSFVTAIDHYGKETDLKEKVQTLMKEWQKVCLREEHRPPPERQAKAREFANKKRKLPADFEQTNNNHDEKADDFDYRWPNQDLYTDEYCRELEGQYWKSILYNTPMYGADMMGSLFDNRTTTWNVDRLENLLNRLNVSIPGVNRAYLYFGMWKATFAWHVEDFDLYSINYIHFGAPKQWYVIPPKFAGEFESFMQGQFAAEYRQCRQFLRHKMFHVSPKVLSDKGIPCGRLVQRQGEFVITFPYGYHAGYNLDYNCAESVNFALESWVPLGRRAQFCPCQGDSVKIDVGSTFKDLLDGGKKDESIIVSENDRHLIAPSFSTKPRISSVTGKRAASSRNSADAPVKKPKKIKLVQKQEQCELCPVPEGPLCRTEEGLFAHGLCASFVPETFIATLDDEEGTEYVVGLQAIPQERWELTCEVCNSKNGACIQCAESKCTRAFHAACAQKDKYHLQQRITQNGEFIYEAFCKTHDPRVQAEIARKNSDLAPYVVLGAEVWAKTMGAWYKGVIEARDDSRAACRVLFNDGYAKTVYWRSLRFSDPEVTTL